MFLHILMPCVLFPIHYARVVNGSTGSNEESDRQKSIFCSRRSNVHIETAATVWVSFLFYKMRHPYCLFLVDVRFQEHCTQRATVVGSEQTSQIRYWQRSSGSSLTRRPIQIELGLNTSKKQYC